MSSPPTNLITIKINPSNLLIVNPQAWYIDPLIALAAFSHSSGTLLSEIYFSQYITFIATLAYELVNTLSAAVISRQHNKKAIQ